MQSATYWIIGESPGENQHSNNYKAHTNQNRLTPQGWSSNQGLLVWPGLNPQVLRDLGSPKGGPRDVGEGAGSTAERGFGGGYSLTCMKILWDFTW